MEVTDRELWHEVNTVPSRSEIDDIWETQDRIYNREIGQAQQEFIDRVYWARGQVEEWIYQVQQQNPQLSLLQAAMFVRQKVNCWIRQYREELHRAINVKKRKLREDKIRAMIALGLLPNTGFATQYVAGEGISIQSRQATRG